MYYPPNNDQPTQQGFYPPNSYQREMQSSYPPHQQSPYFSPQPDQFVPPPLKNGKRQRDRHKKQKGRGMLSIGCGLLVILLAISAFLVVMGGKGQSFSSLISGVTIATGTPPIPTRAPFLSTDQPTVTATPLTPTPTPTPTHPPLPTLPPAGVNGNPWGYTFAQGKLITAPPVAFCSYFSCNPGFSKGVGYVVECQDGTYEKSGGVIGSCVKHGGSLRPLYSH